MNLMTWILALVCIGGPIWVFISMTREGDNE